MVNPRIPTTTATPRPGRSGGSSAACITRRAALAGLAACIAAPPALASGIRFTHAFGETVLPRPASRVVSLGFNTQDTLLALGVAPIAVRAWYGNFPFSIWPWAQPYLKGAEPVVLSGEVSMEVVASLQPDLIVAMSSGISEAEYAVLSRIAPVLMHDKAHSAYGTPWDEKARTIGRALGKSDLAETLIAEARQRFADARGRHPEWSGRTAVAAYHWGGTTGVFIGEDTRAHFLAELGFRPTPGISKLKGSQLFYADLSPEDLTPLDADVLVWISAFERAPDLVALPMRRTLKAHREGREVFVGAVLAGAMSFGSILSLPYALAEMEADLAAAADGLPGTSVASAAKAGLAP